MANSKKAKNNKSFSFDKMYKNINVKETVKNIKNYDVKGTVKNIKNIDVKGAVKSINHFAFETTEVVVDEVIEKSAQWQKVADKAIQAGLKMSANQQDVTFKALETVKSQVLKSSKRMKGMFSKN